MREGRKMLGYTLTSAVAILAAHANSAAAAVLNDGTTTANLSVYSNIGPAGGNSANAFVNPGGNDLRIEVSNTSTANALKPVFAASTAPGDTTFTTSADITMSNPADASDRPGVAIIDTSTKKGVGLYFRGSQGYRVTLLDLNQASFESLLLNTTAFTGGTNTSGKLNASLAISLGGANSNSSGIGVTVTDSASVVSTTTLSAQDLSAYLPASDLSSMVVGYWGFYPSTAANNNPTSVGTFDNLTLTPVPEPTAAIGLVVCGLGALSRRASRRGLK